MPENITKRTHARRQFTSAALVFFALSTVSGCGAEGPDRDLVPREGDDVAEAASPPARRSGASDPVRASADDAGAPAIVFLGTSLTAGYGLDDPDDAFPGLIAARIDSLGLDFRVVNAGVSGDTSAGGLERLEWLLRTPVDVLVLELGANDGLRGLDLDALESNLERIIEQTRARYPDVEIVLAGMEAPPNLGARYTGRFRQVFVDVATEHDTHLIPFLLDGVAGVRELNQSDRIHPTPEGHAQVAEVVWGALEEILQ